MFSDVVDAGVVVGVSVGSVVVVSGGILFSVWVKLASKTPLTCNPAVTNKIKAKARRICSIVSEWFITTSIAKLTRSLLQ